MTSTPRDQSLSGSTSWTSAGELVRLQQQLRNMVGLLGQSLTWIGPRILIVGPSELSPGFST